MSISEFLIRHLIPLYPDDYDSPPFTEQPTMSKTTTRLPGHTEFELVLFRSASWDGFYIYAPNLEHSYQLTKMYPCLSWIDKHNYDFVDIPTDVELDNWDHVFLCANADCAFPPKYLVSALDESDALTEVISWTNACLISEPDTEDYQQADGEGKEDVTWDDNGRPNDVSQLIIVKLFPVLTLANLEPINHVYSKDVK